LAVIALASSGVLTRAQAAGHDDDGDGQPLAKEAEVLDLLAAYHGALAYGGNATAMASLWADDGSLTLNNGTPYLGKTAVLGFFTSGPYFTHNWVSLAPEWKTTISIHGNTAEATTECIATDPVANVVKGIIQVNVTCKKIRGQWLFTNMNNFTQPSI
jgi:hypothetical protein